jgi:transposase
MVTQHIVGGRCAGTIFGGFARSSGRDAGIGGIGASGGEPVWDQRQHGDSLGPAVAGGRSRAVARDGWRSPLASGGPPRRGIGAGCQATGPDLAGDPRRVGGSLRDYCGADEFVAFSQGTENHAQKKSLHAAEQDRADVAEARRVFIRRQPALDPDHLVFLDETWATTNMARRYGRAGRGLRLLAPVPHGHWKVTTLVAGLRTSGITAPCVFDGAINGERFRAYVEQMLAPTLRPHDVVMLDNLTSHKAAGVAEAITAQGAHLVYLPPYSPDLNPIEQAFAKFKAALRQAAERTREGLWQLIGQTLDHFQPQECRNFFKNAGYAI